MERSGGASSSAGGVPAQIIGAPGLTCAQEERKQTPVVMLTSASGRESALPSRLTTGLKCSVVKSVAGAKGNYELRVLDHEPGKFVFTAWRNVSFFFWTARATPGAVVRLAQSTEHLYEENPRGVSNVHVVESDVGLPSPEVRELLLGLMRRRADRRACLGVVPAGSGFWASTLRSFVTGMRLVSPRSFEIGVHTSLAQVADWLPDVHLAKTGVQLDSRVLLEMMVRSETLSRQPAVRAESADIATS